LPSAITVVEVYAESGVEVYTEVYAVSPTLVVSAASGLPLAEERGAAAAAPRMLLTAVRSAADVPPRLS